MASILNKAAQDKLHDTTQGEATDPTEMSTTRAGDTTW